MAPVNDWLSRVVVPDLYPRKEDPFRPGIGIAPDGTVVSAPMSAEAIRRAEFYSSVTDPGQRPVVYQRALNFQVTADVTPIPLMSSQFQCDTIVLDVHFAAANSVFFGYGAGVTVAGGMEIRPGLPIVIAPENTRELWEIQRTLEAMVSMMAADRGMEGLPVFRAPRVVFNAADFFLIAIAPTTVSVMLYMIPELQ